MATRYEQQAARIIDRCRELARISDVPGETTRLFLSPATRQAHALLTGWMRDAGLTVRTDAIGNIRGVLPGPSPSAPRLLIGSHIDTVPNAGAFDGPLGVLLGLACIEELRATSTRPAYSIELIAFSEEEGVRFSTTFMSSLALIGELDLALLNRTDRDGISLAAAIRDFGLDPAEIPAAATNAAAYLEFHIEQGPALDAEDRALAVVSAIAGQSRLALTFTGHSNHAGTTPMGSLRRDALAAAAQFVTEVERYALATPGLVATVGKLEVPGGAGNVVPGRVTATLDVRHPDDATRHAAINDLLAFAQQAATSRRVEFHHTITLDQPAVLMDPHLTSQLSSAVAAITSQPARLLASGAGHDAMIVARKIPSAMLFLRSPNGLSHHPDESVLPADVASALVAGIHFLRQLQL